MLDAKDHRTAHWTIAAVHPDGDYADAEPHSFPDLFCFSLALVPAWGFPHLTVHAALDAACPS